MALAGIPRFAGKISIVVSVPDAAEAAAFYARAFGGEEIARYIVDRHPPSVGPVKGVTMRIGEAVISISTANPRTPQTMDKWGAKTPRVLGGFSTMLTLYVDDVDAVAARAVAAGAWQHGATEDATFGDRVAIIEDPFGHAWALLTVKEEMTVAEHNRRGRAGRSSCVALGNDSG
jgi:PhnB protein